MNIKSIFLFKTKLTFKAILFLPIILILAIAFFGLNSCSLSSTAPSFEAVIICEEINENTLEPGVAKETFDPAIRKIFAVVKYYNIKEKDIYSFVWTNIDTNKILKTKDYLSDKSNLSDGNIVSVLTIAADNLAFSPGKYKVDFIHNGKVLSTGKFEIDSPDMKIASALLTDILNKDAIPVTANDILEFKQTDSIYLSVKMNYLIKDSIITAKWFYEEELLLEFPYIIKENFYKESYLPFGIQNNTGINPPGSYIVEIYINDSLIETKKFKVLETELNTAKFSKNLKYTNSEEGISFIYPDEWKYLESGNNDDFQVQIVPVSADMEIGFLFRSIKNVKDFSADSLQKIALSVANPFIEENSLKEISSTSNNYLDNTNSTAAYPRYEILKEYTDKNNKIWSIPACFIINDQDLYLLFGIINKTMYEDDGEIILRKIVDSIEFD